MVFPLRGTERLTPLLLSPRVRSGRSRGMGSCYFRPPTVIPSSPSPGRHSQTVAADRFNAPLLHLHCKNTFPAPLPLLINGDTSLVSMMIWQRSRRDHVAAVLLNGQDPGAHLTNCLHSTSSNADFYTGLKLRLCDL